MDGQLLDIEHEIELSEPKNARDGYKLYKTLREIRLTRRKAKEENEIIAPFYNFIIQNKDYKNKLSQVQGEAQKICEVQQKRMYIPRQRQDLTIVGKKCETYEPFEDQIKEFKKNRIYEQGGKLRNAAK